MSGGPDDGSERIGGLSGPDAIRRVSRTSTLASGTLACPSCDAPVSPAGRMTPASALECPFCGRIGRVRDFLTLGSPTRPAHVIIRVVAPSQLRIVPRDADAS
ncbi:hypothetical protein [Baekduia sp. Peel2402]|uniref:hypothetical protein n=1 Tax=Baekduia sp. Peel2402 TaxID=3458296 RepID=UPI00403EEB96